MQLRARSIQKLVASIATLCLSAVGLMAIAQAVDAEETGIVAGCYRIAWTGEDNVFALDEQVFVAEIDGRDRVRVSAPGPYKVLGDKFAAPHWLPDGRLVVHTAGSSVLFVVDADGADPRPINLGPSRAEEIYVSPDGSKLAYYDWDRSTIEIVDLFGTRLGSVASDFATVTFSPNGSKMAWGTSAGLSVADSDGTNAQVINPNPARNADWSADGAKLAWISGSSIVTTDVDGSNPTMVPAPGAAGPTWSPDRSHLAWVSFDDYSVWVGDTTGANAKLIGYTDDYTRGDVSWSPDGVYVAWNHFDGTTVSTAEGSVQEDIMVGGVPAIVNFGATFSPCVFDPPASPPENDDFAHAAVLGPEVSAGLRDDGFHLVSGTNVDAGAEFGEPRHEPPTYFDARRSVWWQWTPAEDAVIEIDVGDSSFEAVAAVYTGESVNALMSVVRSDPETQKMFFSAQAGVPYHIAVDSHRNADEGDISMWLRLPTVDTDDCTIIGTDAGEVLMGTSGADVICGYGGDDTIYGLGGADIIFGGLGDDRILAGGGNDLVVAGDGFDRIFGGAGDDLVSAGHDADRVFGASGNDVLFGDQGNDKLFGSLGDDSLLGGGGRDQLFGGDGINMLDGGGADNYCKIGLGIDTLVNC